MVKKGTYPTAPRRRQRLTRDVRVMTDSTGRRIYILETLPDHLLLSEPLAGAIAREALVSFQDAAWLNRQASTLRMIRVYEGAESYIERTGLRPVMPFAARLEGADECTECGKRFTAGPRAKRPICPECR